MNTTELSLRAKNIRRRIHNQGGVCVRFNAWQHNTGGGSTNTYLISIVSDLLTCDNQCVMGEAGDLDEAEEIAIAEFNASVDGEHQVKPKPKAIMVPAVDDHADVERWDTAAD